MSSAAPTITALRGGNGKPAWAPAWAPSAGTLDYLQKLATIVLLALGFLYFVGFDKLKPFAQRHVAAV